MTYAPKDSIASVLFAAERTQMQMRAEWARIEGEWMVTAVPRDRLPNMSVRVLDNGHGVMDRIRNSRTIDLVRYGWCSQPAPVHPDDVLPTIERDDLRFERRAPTHDLSWDGITELHAAAMAANDPAAECLARPTRRLREAHARKTDAGRLYESMIRRHIAPVTVFYTMQATIGMDTPNRTLYVVDGSFLPLAVDVVTGRVRTYPIAGFVSRREP